MTLRQVMPSAGERPLVLVIEDDPDLADILAEVMQDEGYRVCRADSLSSARASWERERPAVVVLDLWIDGESTEGVLAERAGNDESIVLCSGSNGARAIADTFGVPFVRKPFELEELLSAMRERPTGR